MSDIGIARYIFKLAAKPLDSISYKFYTENVTYYFREIILLLFVFIT